MRGRCKSGLVVAALGVGILLALILPSSFFIVLLGIALICAGIGICKRR